MKKIIAPIFFMLCLTRTHLSAETVYDLYQPCTYGNNDAGWQAKIKNNTKKTIKGKMFYALASYDLAVAEFEIPAGDLLLLNSCLVKNRMGLVSQTAVSASGKVAEKTLKALEVPVSGEVVGAILDSQLQYPVCFQRVEFVYEETLGNNAFSSRPPTKKTYTYYHSFGPLQTGIVCYNLDMKLEESNSELVLKSENGETWRWTDKILTT
ncbi:MAG: hypothetical protein K2X90_00475 [Candidatus Babeliaceae bacterium]|nr:hypothetical protein [Candidatus Babeliaceae bacterium]